MLRFMFLCGIVLASLTLMWGLVDAATSTDYAPTLSDEFNDAATLANWQSLATNSTTAITIDIDSSTPGHLVMVPSNIRHTGQPNNNGWYANGRGPYLYKEVSGDFIVTSYIIASNVQDAGGAPTGDYNSAGYVLRDPASVSGSENWIMFNHGYQTAASGGLATEGKTTVNSSSVLTLTATGGVNSGQLTVCRIGDHYYMYKLMDGMADWELDHAMVRPDLPDTLQVGLVVNGWTQPDLYAAFDYVRFYTGTIEQSADCINQLTVPTEVGMRRSSAEVRSATYLPLLAALAACTPSLLWIASRNR